MMAGLAGMAGLGAMRSMMGGSDAAIELPAIKVGCAVCTVYSLDPAAISLGEAELPDDAVTVILGTPVCRAHAARLLESFLGGK